MDHFHYINGELHAEEVPIANIVKEVGTPTYVYSRATLERHWHAFNDAFADHPHMICYSVKANSNLAVLNLFARLNSGFDVVSIGELERVIAAGGDPKKVIYSGIAKSVADMQRALELDIHCFNVESHAELERLNVVAGEMKVKAPVSLRINPNVDPKTHPYISTGLKENKFGIAYEKAKQIYLLARDMKNINVIGLDCHIGSQITELSPFMDALERLLELIDELREHNIEIEHLDLGGGLGVQYRDETPPHPSEQAAAIRDRLKGNPIKILIEPGRAIAANAGVLLTRVEYLKHNEDKNFAIVDAAMNDLLRPALYNAWHTILPVKQLNEDDSVDEKIYDVVGPVCETADCLGHDRSLKIQANDLLAVRSAGAYGFVMSSNYNTRGRPAEVMVDNDKFFVVRKREELQDLFGTESCLP